MQNDFESIFILASSNRRRIKSWNHYNHYNFTRINLLDFLFYRTILPFPKSLIQTNVDKSTKTQWRFQPRSQSLSSLPPLVVGTETLVAAGHVTIYPSKTAGWVGTQIYFCLLYTSDAADE